MDNQKQAPPQQPPAPEVWRDGESRVYKSVDCGRGKCDRMVGNVLMFNDMGKCWRGICPVCEGDLYMSNRTAESTSYIEAPKEPAPVTEAKEPESILVSGNDWIEIELGGGIPINQLFEVQIEGGDIVRAFAHYIIPDGIGPRWWGYGPDGGFVIKGKVTHYARPRLGPHDSPLATETPEAAPLPSEAASEASSYGAFGPMHVDQSPPIAGQAVSFYDEKRGKWREGRYLPFRDRLAFATEDKKGKLKAYSSDRAKWWQAPNAPPPDEARQVAEVGSEAVVKGDNTKLYIYTKEDDENVNPHA